MKILAVDTATQTCSVALTEKDSPKIELSVDHAQTHARHLLKMIDEVLDQGGVCLEEIDGFAVTIGPGSFTGLRIGISTVKGLALAAKKPVAPVSSLEALASQFIGASQLICPWIDARKKEVYSAAYRWQDDRLETVAAPRVASPDAVLAEISEPAVFVGNGAAAYSRRISECLGSLASLCPAAMNMIRAGMVAAMGYRLLRNGSAKDPALLTPFYIRRSDARKPGEKKA